MPIYGNRTTTYGHNQGRPIGSPAHRGEVVCFHLGRRVRHQVVGELHYRAPDAHMQAYLIDYRMVRLPYISMLYVWAGG